jgi:membrane-bound serine protease (ClpP class)
MTIRYVFFLSCLIVSNLFAQLPIKYGTLGKDQLHARFSEAIKCNPQEQRPIGYIYFSKEHPIDEATYYYAKEALKYFKEEKVCFVVVDLNCYGGALFPAIKIADLFQKFDINQKIPLIAYINDYAIGSAAMLAYACRFIAVNENSYMGGQLPNQKIKIQSTPEHLMPYILNEYSSLATTFGRDPILAEAMADISLIVVERQGKLFGFYNRLDIKQDGSNSDKILATDTEWLCLNGQQLIKYGIAEIMIPAKQMKVQQGQMFSQLPLAQEEYLKSFGQSKMLVYFSWIINILLFLSTPLIASTLLSLVVVLLYVQIKKPKLSLSFVGLIVSISLLVIASLGIQAVSWIELSFLILGLTIIFLDSFLTEGSLAICAFGGLLVVFSLFMMMLPGFEKFSLLDFEAFSFAAGSLATRVVYLIAGVVFALAACLYLEKKFFKHQAFLKKQRQEMGEMEVQSKISAGMQAEPGLGSYGVAYSSLRPDGKVLIGDRLYDATSFNKVIILKKKKVVVVALDKGLVVVKEVIF